MGFSPFNIIILIKDNGSIKEVNIDDNAFSRITVSESNDIIIYDICNIYIYNLKDGILKKEIDLDDEILIWLKDNKFENKVKLSFI